MHVECLWSASGVHLECNWDAAGHLEYICNALGVHVERTSTISGVGVVCGAAMEYDCGAVGMCVERIWNATWVHL